MPKKNSFPVPAFADVDRSSLTAALPRIDDIFTNFYEKHRIPGLIYGIVADGNLIHVASMGTRRAGEDAPIDGDTVFRIASMSKSFAAMAVIRLRDDGKLRLDEPAATYVPELAKLPYPTRDSAPITVFQLLTMGAGFPQDDPWADRQLNAAPKTFSAWMRGGVSFSNPPNLKYEYSNFGYGVIGRIVTNVSGMPYQQYVRQTILEPLGMNSTTYDVREVDPERLAMGYRHEGAGWAEETPLEDGEFGAMGGLFTTINDFSRYMNFLLAAFPPRDETDKGVPIRRASAREMQTPWRQRNIASSRPTPDAPTYFVSDGYGFGLSCGIDSVVGYSVAHGGGLPGYGTFYRLLPECGIGLVAFTNLTYAGPAAPIFDALSLLAGSGSLVRRTLPPAPALLAAQDAITSLYNAWDDDALRSISTSDASFFLDTPLEARREEFAKLRKRFGKCLSVTPFEPENALRGAWIMKCKRGNIEAYITLAPTVPPLVQVLDLTGKMPLNAPLKRATKRILHLIESWDEGLAKATFARALKPKTLRPQFEALHVQYGSLKIAEIIESDGERSAVLRLDGARGTLALQITLSGSGRVRAISFGKPYGTAYVP